MHPTSIATDVLGLLSFAAAFAPVKSNRVFFGGLRGVNASKEEVAMKLHWGQTNYPGCFRFHRTTISWEKDDARYESDCYFEHPIKWWVGISFARSFFGFVRTDHTRDERGPSRLANQ